MTVEYQVLKPEFAALFSREEVRDRLEEKGMRADDLP
jgi:hypothetical protein